MEGSAHDVEEQQENPTDCCGFWYDDYFKFDRRRDSVDQIRNALLVAAVLVATASFQTAMSLPDPIKKGSDATTIIFICAITLAWSSSISVMEMLTSSLPYQREIRMSYASMAFAFGAGLRSQVPDVKGELATILFVVFALLPWLSRRGPQIIAMICCRCKLS